MSKTKKKVTQPRKAAQKTAHFNVRVSEEDRETLRAVGAELDIPPAVLVRYAIRKYVVHCKDLKARNIIEFDTQEG